MQNDYDKLMQYALRLISRKRYTEFEIQKKLKAKKIGKSKDIEKVIKRLKELQYIDDFEFAKDYISNRIMLNPRGKRMLELELKFKRIDKELINKAIEEAKIDEFKVANDFLLRKNRVLAKYKSQKKKEKIMSILASRGFEFDTIYKILEKC